MIRVVKIGGSLFDLPRLPERLRNWLSAQTSAHHVLLPGGGSLVEEVRAWNLLAPMDEAVAHWMCVDRLAVTAQLVHDWLPEVPLIEDERELRTRLRLPGATIFSSAAWMRLVEPKLPGTQLPCTWQTTSDSIAARLASVLHADELVLLKSTLPTAPPTGDAMSLSATGYVDSMFAHFLDELPPTRLVNFRADPLRELILPRDVGPRALEIGFEATR